MRRQKTYSAESGYVYQYFYEGQRAATRDGDAGAEYVFNVSADRKSSFSLSVFVGDMTATTGLFSEFVHYCFGHALPVRAGIEDNGLSTNADTKATWGRECQFKRIESYHYTRTMPHVGLAERVSF